MQRSEEQIREEQRRLKANGNANPQRSNIPKAAPSWGRRTTQTKLYDVTDKQNEKPKLLRLISGEVV